MLNAGTLYHGGIMVNYQCNAACRHCLYSCSPKRKAGYVNKDSAEKICALLRKGGCRSVHIGGGEPFLNFESLVMMIRALNHAGVNLEYIETNAFWITDASKARDQLERLLAEGANTLCISIDPFHGEHIPYGAPLALAKLCDKTGMGYFLWRQEFLPALSHLDPEKTHLLSKESIVKIARQYGVIYGGRAVNIEKEMHISHNVEHFAGDAAPCKNLLSTGHFHVDMEGYFIPPGCTGIRIPLEEVIEDIPREKYPAFDALYYNGVSGLLELALQNGFTPDNAGYPSKCSLCFYLRKFLSEKNFAELDQNHYEEAFSVCL
jgi:hypothetical protein